MQLKLSEVSFDLLVVPLLLLLALEVFQLLDLSLKSFDLFGCPFVLLPQICMLLLQLNVFGFIVVVVESEALAFSLQVFHDELLVFYSQRMHRSLLLNSH